MIADLKPYDAMTDSGIEWLGKVPEHWEVRRLGDSVLGCINGVWGSDPDGVHDLRCVRVADFDRSSLRVRRPIPTMRAIAPNERKRRMLKAGDLLLEKSGGGYQQPVGVAILFDHDSPAVCSNFVARMPVREGYDSGFLTFLHSSLYAVGLNTRSIKQTTGIQNLDSASYLGEVVAYPSLPEQAAIVRFLDYKDRRIRRYIRAKQKLIKLLEEQKQAIIHRAVTRGLDPDVPLKDSGVEWLGEVPEHWEVARLRNVTKSVTSGSRGWSSYAADEGPLFIRVANLNRMSLDLRFHDVVRLELPKTSEVVRTRVQVGDLLLSITAYIGSVAVVPDGLEEAYVSQHVARCALSDDSHNPQWLGYVLLSELGQRHGKLSLYGGTKDGLSLDDVKNYPLLLPPRSEQNQLVEDIERGVGNIDTASANANHEIELLNEYRTRLIADVVTGKLDVREAAAGLPDEAEEMEPLDEFDAIPEVAEAWPPDETMTTSPAWCASYASCRKKPSGLSSS